MTALQLISAVVGIFVGLCSLAFTIVVAGKYVLNSFHTVHVKPELVKVHSALDMSATKFEHALANNAHATSENTIALAASDATQRAAQIDNREAFTRMGDILADHETRITVNEGDINRLCIEKTRPAPKMRPKRGGG